MQAIVKILIFMAILHFAGGWIFARQLPSDEGTSRPDQVKQECMERYIYRDFLWEKFIYQYITDVPSRQSAMYRASFNCTGVAEQYR